MTTTTHDAFRPDIWTQEIIRAFEANLVLADKVARYDQDVVSRGNTVQIPNLSNLVANDKVANTQVTLQAPTETTTTITIDQHKEASFLVEDIVGIQSNSNLLAEYTNKAGYAIKRAVDTAIANLATGLSTSAGTYNTTLTVAALNSAVQSLDDGDVPRQDRCWILKPHAINDLYTLSDYMRYDGTGYAGGYASGGVGNAMDVRPNGLVGRLYGSDVYMTSQIAQTGNNISNLYMHREAFGLAMQKAPRVQSQYKQEYLGTLVTADVLYGVAELRDAAGVELRN